MKFHYLNILSIAAVGLLLCAGPALAQMDTNFTYQGRLMESGTPVTDLVSMRFSLWDAAAGGSQLGSTYTAMNVDVVEGLFTVLIDSANFGTHGFNGEPRWLQVLVYDASGGSWITLSPRHPITPAPYALYAADGAGGGGTCLWSENGTKIYYNTDNVGIGTADPNAPLHITTAGDPVAMLARNTATTGSGSGAWSETASSTGSGVFGQNTNPGTGDSAGVKGVAWGTYAKGVFGYNGSTASSAIGALGRTSRGYGVRGETTSTTSGGTGVYGETSSTSGYGVYGSAPDTGKGVAGYSGSDNYGYLGWNGGGVYGRSTDGYGIRGYSVNDWGIFGSVPFGSTQAGVVGAITLSNGAVQWVPQSGVCGSSEDGYGVSGRVDGGYAVYGTHDDTGNFGYLATPTEGAYGEHDATGNFGRLGSAEAGVYGESDDSGDNGVRGIHTLANNDRAGVYGEHAVTDYYGIGVKGVGGYRGVQGNVTPTGGNSYCGVRGEVSGGSGVNYGVFGTAGDGNYNYGVFGSASGGGTNYAGYFNGNVGVSGTLSKGGGTFKIDHPLDPEHKYLFHSFVESPDMMNIYNGNIMLGDNGEAVVTMPEWFEALNMEFRYQLTCIGGFAQVYIAEEIAGNQFKIAGGKPGLKVSWQVTGIRQDPFANANRVQVEVDKPEDEVGTYLHPEAWGVSPDLQIDRVRESRRQTELETPIK